MVVKVIGSLLTIERGHLFRNDDEQCTTRLPLYELLYDNSLSNEV